MPTTLTISTPDAVAGKSSGPHRYPPQSEATPPAQRFAELLQRRREALPPAKAPQPEPKPEANPEAKGEPGAKPIAGAPGNDDARRSADDNNAAGDEDKPADDEAPQASSGCAASGPQTASKTTTRPTAKRRDLPIVDVPMLPPTIAIDTPTLSGASAASDGMPGVTNGASRADAAPALASTDPAFGPGIPAAAADAAATAHDASAGGGNGALDLRVGAGAAAGGSPGAAAAGLTLAGGAAGNAGQHGASRQDAGGQGSNAAADNAAALLAAAASNTEGMAAANAAADRLAQPPRTPALDVSLAGWAGGIAAHHMEGSAAAPAALPTPLTAPDFAKALGAQVSLFARNGLARAELQLTPAEMGPIRVQITIDGAHARVDFAAESAATRQVIERGLPELASALREQGLTLAGGGVFQRAPDQSGDGQAKQTDQAVGRARGRATAAAPDAAQSVRLRTSAAQPGGVDLYA